MFRNTTRILALILALAAALAAVYGGRVFASWHQPDSSAKSSAPPATNGDRAKMAMPGERKVLYWFDPMHPAYKSDKPGIAPDCGMKLVPKYADEENAAPGVVTIAPDKQALIGVRTATVEPEALVRVLRTNGQVVADETRIAHVHVKVSGYIDRVFADFIGQLVRKGQPLFTLYSPDLLATEEEYLIARRGDATLGKSEFKEVSEGSRSLLRAARDRLKLWDITDAQIKKLDDTGEVSKYLTFYSPITGFVTDRKAFSQTAVNPDMELYTVADLSHVWVTADVYQYEAPYVHVGQTAQMQLSYYPGRTWTGRVAYVDPMLDPQTHTLKVRIDVPNPKFELKPQMFADVSLKIDYGRQIAVPEDAVLNSGQQQVVFVIRDGDQFEPRHVTLGPRVDGGVIVLSGLKPGDTIVTSGNFLIDSESRLNSAMEGMQH